MKHHAYGEHAPTPHVMACNGTLYATLCNILVYVLHVRLNIIRPMPHVMSRYIK